MNDTHTEPGADSDSALLFSAPVKWEQNCLTHSFGTLSVSGKSVDYAPGRVSVLGSTFSIPRDLIESVRRRDNFLWRGAVTLQLKQAVNGRRNFIFFLGGRYQEFLDLMSVQDG